MPLCELLPVAIPSLVADVLYLRNSSQTDDERISRVKVSASCLECFIQSSFSYVMRLWFLSVCCFVQTILSCSQASPSMLAPRKFSNETYFPTPELEFVTCNFTGSKIYNVVCLCYVMIVLGKITGFRDNSSSSLQETDSYGIYE